MFYLIVAIGSFLLGICLARTAWLETIFALLNTRNRECRLCLIVMMSLFSVVVFTLVYIFFAPVLNAGGTKKFTLVFTSAFCGSLSGVLNRVLDHDKLTIRHDVNQLTTCKGVYLLYRVSTATALGVFVAVSLSSLEGVKLSIHSLALAAFVTAHLYDLTKTSFR